MPNVFKAFLPYAKMKDIKPRSPKTLKEIDDKNIFNINAQMKDNKIPKAMRRSTNFSILKSILIVKKPVYKFIFRFPNIFTNKTANNHSKTAISPDSKTAITPNAPDSKQPITKNNTLLNQAQHFNKSVKQEDKKIKERNEVIEYRQKQNSNYQLIPRTNQDNMPIIEDIKNNCGTADQKNYSFDINSFPKNFNIEALNEFEFVYEKIKKNLLKGSIFGILQGNKFFYLYREKNAVMSTLIIDPSIISGKMFFGYIRLPMEGYLTGAHTHINLGKKMHNKIFIFGYLTSQKSSHDENSKESPNTLIAKSNIEGKNTPQYFKKTVKICDPNLINLPEEKEKQVIAYLDEHQETFKKIQEETLKPYTNKISTVKVEDGKGLSDYDLFLANENKKKALAEACEEFFNSKISPLLKEKYENGRINAKIDATIKNKCKNFVNVNPDAEVILKQFILEYKEKNINNSYDKNK